MGKVKRRAHRPAHPTKEAVWDGGVLSSARAISPNARHSGSDVWSGWGRKRNQGLDLQPPTLFFPCCSSSSPGLILPSPPITRTTSFLLILAPGLMDPRIGRSRDGRGQGEGIWGKYPQNKYLPFCSSIATSAFVSAASPQRSLPLFPLLPPEEPLEAASDCQPALWTLGVWLFSQILWKKEAPAVCGPDLNPHMNLTAGDYWIIL